MKTPLILAALLLIAPLAASAGTLNTHLEADVNLEGEILALADCDVPAPAGATIEAVLNQALAQGCIVDWSCTDFGFDCFVDRINFVAAPPGYFYAFYEDGGFAGAGIRGTFARDGGDYRFSLERWLGA